MLATVVGAVPAAADEQSVEDAAMSRLPNMDKIATRKRVSRPLLISF